MAKLSKRVRAFKEKVEPAKPIRWMRRLAC